MQSHLPAGPDLSRLPSAAALEATRGRHLGTFTGELKRRAERNPFDPLPAIAALGSGNVDHPWWVDLIGIAALASFIFAVGKWIGAL